MPMMIVLLAAVCSQAQTEGATLGWQIPVGEELVLDWNCLYKERFERAKRTSALYQFRDITDERVVELHLYCVRKGPKEPVFQVKPRKAEWTFTTDLWRVVATLEEGKPAEAKAIVKTRDSLLAVDAARSAELKKSEMLSMIAVEHALRPAVVRGQESTMVGDMLVWKGNGSGRELISILNLAYVHSRFPVEPVIRGQTWKEPVVAVSTAGNYGFRINDIDLRVSEVGKDSITVKGGASKPFTNAAQADTKTVGQSTFDHEFSFTRDGSFLSSKEQFTHRHSTVSKEVTSCVEESFSLKQSMVLRKKPPPKQVK